MAIKEAILEGCLDGERVVITISQSPFDVGRNKTANLIIPHVGISRNHCQFFFDENQKWTIQDMSSSGTFVNRRLIGKGNNVGVNHGDVIRFGPPENNFIWNFFSDGEDRGDGNARLAPDNMNAQSQAIVDICTRKNNLERRMIVQKESHVKIKNEREKLEKEFAEQLKLMELKHTKEREELQNATAEMKQEMEQRAREEKEKVEKAAEEKSKYFQQKLQENDQLEMQLKSEVQKLQEKLEEEKKQWEANFLEEKKKLEEKLTEKEKEFTCERIKVEENEKAWEDKLNKEEQEKHLLQKKLQEMEAAQSMLQQKLKETNESHLLEKAKVEEEMLKEKIRQEEKLKEEIEKSLKAEMEKKESAKSNALQKELEEVKKSKELLEQELATTTMIREEASNVTNKILANITDVMESELNCSICSELFVTAITLNCTHTFCQFCINEWKKKKKNCPICRKKISSENRSIVMDNYIDKMVENFSKDLKERREAIVLERNGGVPAKKPKLEPAPNVVPPNQAPGPSNVYRSSSSTSTSGGGQGRNDARPAQNSSSSTSAPNRAMPIQTIDLTRDNIVRNIPLPPANIPTMVMQRLPAVRGPNQTQMYQQLPSSVLRPIPPGAIPPGARVTLVPLNNNVGLNPGGPNYGGPVYITSNALRPGIPPNVRGQTAVAPQGHAQSTSSPSSERTEVNSDSDNDSDRTDSDDDDRDDGDSDDNSDRSNSGDDYDDGDSDSDRSVEGRPGVYYGGYGRCYRCNQRGHWANGCPNRY